METSSMVFCERFYKKIQSGVWLLSIIDRKFNDDEFYKSLKNHLISYGVVFE